MDIIVKALIKSLCSGSHTGKSGCRLKKWRATASVILHCLR